MHWKFKAALFQMLSRVPFGDQIHYQIQRRITKEVPRRSDYLDQLLVAAKSLLNDIKEQTALNLSDCHFIEIGAGRDLAVAVALRLMGVKHVTCIDITKLAKPHLIENAAQYMAKRLGKKCPNIGSWIDVEAFGIKYAAPKDIVALNLDDASIDCFYSVDTLEHIPRESLINIFKEVRRIMKPDGVTIHFIDYSDHYARDNGELSRFNFMTFTERQWQQYNPDLHYVNRLRHSEYIELFINARLKPVIVDATVENVQQEIINKLAPEFRAFSVDDLFTLRAKVVLIPQADVSLQV